MESNDPIRDWLDTPIPEKLWHYTSVQGFYGIASSKEIYATDCRFLNDREEIVHAGAIARTLVQDYPERDSNGLELRKVARFIIDDIFSQERGMFSKQSLQSFVTSFSPARDSLSQWRGYSRGSSGACLGFKVARIHQPYFEVDLGWLVTNSEKGFPTSFAPCVYDEAKKRELLMKALSHVIDAFQEVWAKVPNARPAMALLPKDGRFITPVLNELRPLSQLAIVQKYADANARTMGDLLLITALLKNDSFQEEEEWRLVLWRNASMQIPRFALRFRPTASTLVPYLGFPLESDPDVRLALEDLVVGPGSDEGAISASMQFLQSLDFKIAPKPSAAPYRPT